MAALPQPAGEVGAKRFGDLANFCKLLLVLPHSSADPKRLFSMLGKVETSQRSSLLASTVCDVLSVKLNVDHECYQNKKLFTLHLLGQARSATTRSLSTSCAGSEIETDGGDAAMDPSGHYIKQKEVNSSNLNLSNKFNILGWEVCNLSLYEHQ